MTPVLLAFATFLAILIGGFFSIRNKERLHHIMGFAAGVLLGVVAFDILPEIIEMLSGGSDATPVMIALVLGFIIFHIFEKGLLIHHSHEDDYADHKHPHVGAASSLALAGHSFLDGIGIGLAFQVSAEMGVLVAIAVIAHSFTDGMNTVTFLLSHKNSVRRTRWFLLVHALAPMLGALSTMLFSVSERFLVIYLGFFAGFLLYIGASDILPEAHRKHSSWKTIALTVLGAAFIFAVSRFL